MRLTSLFCFVFFVGGGGASEKGEKLHTALNIKEDNKGILPWPFFSLLF